jgi:uncharacterized protein YkwD
MKAQIALLIAACGHSSTPTSSSSSPSTTTTQDVDTAIAQPDTESDPVTEPKDKPVVTKADAPPRPGDPIVERWVNAHNRYRTKHCAPPLTWSTKLAEVAQKWADTMKAKGCTFEHSGDKRYGENLAGGTSGALDPEATVGMWYDEIKEYTFPDGGFSMKTGHFTQLVWRSTKHVGCGRTTCKGMDLYVCNYDPPGNWEGQYRKEVLPACAK